ncbi:MAG: TetR/AcrR family transcriptional regulator [Dehalococcoidales bacterium]|nr:TetR/AcrR family transcriptional regulator [Dehalococcoidales bacterium]
MDDTGSKVRIPKQKRSAKKKQKLIITAMGLFSQNGYHNTSSNEIAAHAGVSVGSFYAYFRDKKQLFLEVMSYYNDLILKQVETGYVSGGKDLEEILFNFISNTLQAHKIHPEFHQEMMAMYISDPDVRKFVDDQKKQEMEYPLRYLQAAKESLDNRIKIKNLEVASFVIYAAIEKVVHEIAFSDSRISEERIIKELVDMIIKYIFCDLPAEIFQPDGETD